MAGGDGMSTNLKQTELDLLMDVLHAAQNAREWAWMKTSDEMVQYNSALDEALRKWREATE